MRNGSSLKRCMCTVVGLLNEGVRMGWKDHVRIVLVEPEFPVNIGSVARVMANFGFHRLVMVNPHALNETAYMFAKHARDILDNAQLVDSFEEAIKGSAIVIGTTGVPSRYKKEYRFSRAIYELNPFLHESGFIGKEISIVFGRESRGLTQEESSRCDLFVYIPTSHEYPVMNLSHAVSVVLYELSRGQVIGSGGSENIRDVVGKHDLASQEQRTVLYRLFDETVDRLGSAIHFPNKIKQAFRNVIGRSGITRKEVQALSGVFSEVNKRLPKPPTASGD